MTLVIAKIVGERQINIVVDSKLSFDDETLIRLILPLRKQLIYGALKTIILCPETCISFAGNSKFAAELIKELWNQKVNVYDYHSVVDFFDNKRSSQDRYDTDFIVAFLYPQARIFKITCNNTEEVVSDDFVWIGDNEAYKYFLERYQLYKHSESNNNGSIRFSLNGSFEEFNKRMDAQDARTAISSNMNMAFRDVLKNHAFPSVGNFCIKVISPNGFIYSESLELIPGLKVKPVCHKETDSYVMSVGDSEEGGYSVHCISCKEGIGVLGIYFYQGKYGTIFNPIQNLISEDPQTVIAETIEIFKKKLAGVSNNLT